MNPPAKRTRVHHMAGRVWICGGITGHAGRGVERVRDPPLRHPRRVSKVGGYGALGATHDSRDEI